MFGTEFQYILCCGSTPEKNNWLNKRAAFQYILCCGSTIAHTKPIGAKIHNFNTSYVVVQHICNV